MFRQAENNVDIEYVFQKREVFLKGFLCRKGGKSPGARDHAALCAARSIDAPYAVINADDFYGREAFQKIYQFLSNVGNEEKMSFAMVGYSLKNTVTENGSVSRGVCKTAQGMLKGIDERTQIEKRKSGIAYTEDSGETWIQLPEDTVVSMNFWGFTPRLQRN